MVLGDLTPDYTVAPCAGDVVSLTCTFSGALLDWDPPEPTRDISVDSRTTLPFVRDEQYTVTSVMVADGMISSSLSFPAAEGLNIGCFPTGQLMMREELTVQIASERFIVKL